MSLGWEVEKRTRRRGLTLATASSKLAKLTKVPDSEVHLSRRNLQIFIDGIAGDGSAETRCNSRLAIFCRTGVRVDITGVYTDFD